MGEGNKYFEIQLQQFDYIRWTIHQSRGLKVNLILDSKYRQEKAVESRPKLIYFTLWLSLDQTQHN